MSGTSYGSGFEEGYYAARKELGVSKTELLKLIHEDDWGTDISKIAGNSLHGKLKFYKNSEEAVEIVTEFRGNLLNPEGNTSDKERE